MLTLHCKLFSFKEFQIKRSFYYMVFPGKKKRHLTLSILSEVVNIGRI